MTSNALNNMTREKISDQCFVLARERQGSIRFLMVGGVSQHRVYTPKRGMCALPLRISCLVLT